MTPAASAGKSLAAGLARAGAGSAVATSSAAPQLQAARALRTLAINTSRTAPTSHSSHTNAAAATSATSFQQPCSWRTSPNNPNPLNPFQNGQPMHMQMHMQKRAYHEAVMDHFNNPRNIGKLDKKKSNVGSATVGKASCGDVIRLDIEVEKDAATGEERIKDAKFKTFGCGSAIASSSYATERVIGATVGEAAALKNTDISQHLSLPPVKIHCSVLAEEAIQAAIEDYKRKKAAAAGAE